MSTFIRVVEVWAPSEGSLLELRDDLFDAAPTFGASSRLMCFGRAEGLPRQRLGRRAPVAAEPAGGLVLPPHGGGPRGGLSCAMALPIVVGERLTSVVVLPCGDGQAQAMRSAPRFG